MATRELEDTFLWDEDPPLLTTPFLPSFPAESAILEAFPEFLTGGLRLQKTDFLAWVNFTLENPDEIWEHEEPDEPRADKGESGPEAPAGHALRWRAVAMCWAGMHSHWGLPRFALGIVCFIVCAGAIARHSGMREAILSVKSVRGG